MIYLFMALGMISFAFADCDTNLTLGNATIMVQNGQQIIQQPYTIRREDPSNGRCGIYRLYFSKGQANSYQRRAYNGASAASYNLHQGSLALGTLKDVNDALLPVEFIQGTLPNEKVDYSGNFYISVPGLSSQGTLPGGTYTDNVQISVFSVENNGDSLLEEVQPFSINLIVSTLLSVSLVDEGGTFDANSTVRTLNFGVIQQNYELGVDLMVESNTSYQVRVSSLNNGNLARGTDTVSYQFRVNNHPVNLNSSSGNPVTVASGTATSSTPARYNLKARIIGTIDTQRAGEYTDTITITAIAN